MSSTLRVLSSEFVFFAGKGGVGKTTCAIDYALSQRQRPRHSSRGTLIISTDPAHSLGDALGRQLGTEPRRVCARVSAMELDAPRAFGRWMASNRRTVGDIIERGTWLDRGDVDAILDLAIPGVDELASLIEIGALAAGPFERVIVDTAPTGHMLRLLAAPAAVAVVARVLDALAEEHRIIRNRLARVARADAADRFLDILATQAADVAALLRDHRRTAFHWVTLPEQLAVAESADGLAALTSAGVRLAEVVVNRVWREGPRCRNCDPRRVVERRVVRQIQRQMGRRFDVRVVYENTKDAKGTRDTKGSLRKPVGVDVSDAMAFLRGNQRLIFVAGKGGVGKTTAAAAIAMTIARHHPSKRVLLLSTDPAHSLGDVFDAAVGDKAASVPGGPGNLAVRELDASLALKQRRAAFEVALGDIPGFAAGGGDQVIGMFDLAPPGIDELFGMLSIVEAQSTYSTVVVDSAPTGHMLRLLEVSAVARDWIQALLRLLLKYKSLVRPGRIGAELLDASRSVGALQLLLRDPHHTRFIVVTRAEATVRAETERLIRTVRALALPVGPVVANARTLDPRCALCCAAARAEAHQLRALTAFVRKARLRDCAIIQAPLAAPPPRGAAALGRWAGRWQP